MYCLNKSSKECLLSKGGKQILAMYLLSYVNLNRIFHIIASTYNLFCKSKVLILFNFEQ